MKVKDVKVGMTDTLWKVKGHAQAPKVTNVNVGHKHTGIEFDNGSGKLTSYSAQNDSDVSWGDASDVVEPKVSSVTTTENLKTKRKHVVRKGLFGV